MTNFSKFLNCKEQSSCSQRFKYLFAGLALLLPLVNIISFLVLKQFASFETQFHNPVSRPRKTRKKRANDSNSIPKPPSNLKEQLPVQLPQNKSIPRDFKIKSNTEILAFQSNSGETMATEEDINDAKLNEQCPLIEELICQGRLREAWNRLFDFPRIREFENYWLDPHSINFYIPGHLIDEFLKARKKSWQNLSFEIKYYFAKCDKKYASLFIDDILNRVIANNKGDIEDKLKVLCFNYPNAGARILLKHSRTLLNFTPEERIELFQYTFKSLLDYTRRNVLQESEIEYLCYFIGQFQYTIQEVFYNQIGRILEVVKEKYNNEHDVFQKDIYLKAFILISLVQGKYFDQGVFVYEGDTPHLLKTLPNGGEWLRIILSAFSKKDTEERLKLLSLIKTIPANNFYYYFAQLAISSAFLNLSIINRDINFMQHKEAIRASLEAYAFAPTKSHKSEALKTAADLSLYVKEINGQRQLIDKLQFFRENEFRKLPLNYSVRNLTQKELNNVTYEKLKEICHLE